MRPTGLRMESGWAGASTTMSYSLFVSLTDPTDQKIGGSLPGASSGPIQWIAPLTLPSTGVCTLELTPNPGATGTVTLQVLADAVQTTAVVDGPAVSAAVSPSLPGRQVQVTFSGLAGQTVYVNGSADFNASVALRDPTGEAIAGNRETGGLPPLASTWIAPVNLPADGTYTLAVVPDAGASGDLSVQVLGSYVTSATAVDDPDVTMDIPFTAPGKIMKLTFPADAGTAVSVVGVTYAVGGSLTLLDPDGVRIAAGFAVPLIPCPDADPGTCPQVLIPPVTGQVTGQYTVYFTPQAFDVGAVTLSVVGAAGAASPPAMITSSATVDGAAVSVTIPSGSSGERVAVGFTATAGQRVYLNLTSGNTRLSTAALSLVGPNGPIPLRTTSAWLNYPALLEAPIGLPETGAYTLYLVPSGDGTFGLQVLDAYVTAAATVDGPSTSVTVPTAAPAQRVALTFTAAAGQSVYINSNGSRSLNTAGLWLKGPDGPVALPASWGVLGGANNLSTPIGLGADGTYALYFAPEAGATGTLTLQLLSEYVTASPNIGDPVTTVTVPQTNPGERMAVSFTGTAGQSVYINLTNGARTLETTTLRMIGPDGRVVLPEVDSNLGNTAILEAPIGLAADGTYTLYLVPSPDAYGTFSIQLLSSYVSENLTVDGPAATVTVPASAPGQRIALSFTGVAGQSVYMNLNNGDNTLTSASLQMVGPDGRVVLPVGSSNLNRTAILESPVGLAADGTYTLYLIPASDSHGSFSLQILSSYVTASLPVDGGATTVSVPASAPGQRIALSLTTTAAAQSVYLNVTSSTHTLHQVSVHMVGPAGRVVLPAGGGDLSNANNLEGPIGLAAAGTYTLFLVPTSDVSGSFDIQAMASFATATLTVNGGPTPLTIPSTAPFQRVALKFTTDHPGEAVSLSFSGVATMTQSPVTLAGPSGMVLSTPTSVVLSGSGNLLAPIGLPEAGDYTVYLAPWPNATGTLTAALSAYGYRQPWPQTGPGAPPWVDVVPVSDTSLAVSWGEATDYATPPSPIVQYTVYYKTAFSAMATVTVPGTDTGVTLTALAQQGYDIYVTATDQAGLTGPPSVLVKKAPLKNRPSPPTGVTGTAPSQMSVVLSWTASVDYSTPPSAIVEYDVYNGSDLAATVPGTTAVITGLSAATEYTFRVVAVNANTVTGPPSDPVKVTTQT